MENNNELREYKASLNSSIKKGDYETADLIALRNKEFLELALLGYSFDTNANPATLMYLQHVILRYNDPYFYFVAAEVLSATYSIWDGSYSLAIDYYEEWLKHHPNDLVTKQKILSLWTSPDTCVSAKSLIRIAEDVLSEIPDDDYAHRVINAANKSKK